MRRRQLAHRGQLLHAGARGIGVENADADAALVQSVGKAVEDAGHLGVAGHVLDPAAIAHGIAERLQRAFRVGAGHRADARKRPVGGGAVVQHASLGGLALIPGRDRQHARLEVERRRHPVERLHAVGRDRLAVRVQIDEAGSHHEAGRVDHPLGAAEPGADSGDPAIHTATSPIASIPLAGSTTRPPLIIKPLISSFPRKNFSSGKASRGPRKAIPDPIETDFQTGDHLRKC